MHPKQSLAICTKANASMALLCLRRFLLCRSPVQTSHYSVVACWHRCGMHLFRFCDQLSSHVMRRTGITLLLMLGMPEYMVRKVSGHTAHSREFFRYVNFAQSYVTEEIDKVHQKLLSLYQR
jgi:hypothetical protein